MKLGSARIPITIGMILILAHLPVLAENPSVGKIIPRSGSSRLNGTELKLETTLYPGDQVATEQDGVALVLLPGGDQVHLGPASAADVSRAGGVLVVSLERGMTLARSGNGQEVAVNARGLVVRPAGKAAYVVALQEKGVVVSSRRGSVEVQAADRSFAVPEGEAMRFEAAASPQGPVGPGSRNALSPTAKAVIAVAVVGGVITAVLLLLALDDKGRLSPSGP